MEYFAESTFSVVRNHLNSNTTSLFFFLRPKWKRKAAAVDRYSSCATVHTLQEGI